MKKIILSALALIISTSMLFSCGTTAVIGEKNGEVKNEDGEIVHRDKNSYFDGIFSGSRDMMADAETEMSGAGMAPSGKDFSEEKYEVEREPYMPSEPSENTNISAGTLTAGEWRDNSNYAEFLKLLNQNEWYSYMKTWNMFPSRRIAVNTVSGEKALSGVKLTLTDENGTVLWNGVSDHDGNAYMFYDLASEKGGSKPAKIVYALGDVRGEYTLDTIEEPVTLDISEKASENKKKLDLMFMIDTTGSMGDELSYLQEELKDVILRVSEEYKNMDIRLSVNFYRDHGDEYTVRYFKFNNDVNEAIKNLTEQRADGGGDYPEAVDEAFENAVDTHQWEEDSVKLMFFVLDAPPHSDREGSVEKMYNTVLNASEKGIRVMPIASSGVDKETEYILRTMAAVTGGTYIFLTNDSGVGGDHIDASVGDHNVEKLNDLLVRVIKEYCA